MLNIKRAQTAIEFIMMVAFLLFFFTLFLLAVQESSSDKMKENRDIVIREIALEIKDEINMAYSSSEGYLREFDIPLKAGNQDYEVSLVEDMVYVKSGGSSIALPIILVEGNIRKGINEIKKENGKIIING